MRRSIAERLSDVPLRNAKADLEPVQKLNPDAGEALDVARENARIEPKQMADMMEISHSLALRGLKNGNLSFGRLWDLPDAFWAELLVAIARKKRVATVRMLIEVEPSRRPA